MADHSYCHSAAKDGIDQQKINNEEIYDHFKYDLKVRDQDRESAVAEFYRDRNVFITGASGFVGKCLLEKLLRSCSSLKSVYILLRPKRGMDIEERLNVILRSELFDRLRKFPNSSKLFAKVKTIRGDITEPMFGLSGDDLKTLSSEVSVVFHSAATVKFVEPLKVAVSNNVASMSNLIELASQLPRLEALVHVSTAYSNCDRKDVDEIFYKAPIEAERLLEMANWMEAAMFEQIAPTLVGLRPNTYTFTKAVAESLLVTKSKQLIPHVPIAVVRPSIVAGTWQQPIKGWVDNFNGPTGVILSMVTGCLQAMPARSSYCADIVPVDIVANLIVCSAYHVKNELSLGAKQTVKSSSDDESTRLETSDGGLIRIFNCVSGTLNPVSWKDVCQYVTHINDKFPMNNPFRLPGMILISNEHLFSVFNFLSHKCVAYFGDFCLKLIGKKPSLVIIYSRINKMVSTLKPFTTNQWLFKCSNVTNLYESLSPVDQEIFNFDVRQVAWDDYISRYYIGSKTFALKDDPNSLSKARHKRSRMKTSSQVAQLLLLIVAYYLLISGTSLEQYLLESIELLLPNGLHKYLSVGGDGSASGTTTAAAAAATHSARNVIQNLDAVAA